MHLEQPIASCKGDMAVCREYIPATELMKRRGSVMVVKSQVAAESKVWQGCLEMESKAPIFQPVANNGDQVLWKPEVFQGRKGPGPGEQIISRERCNNRHPTLLRRRRGQQTREPTGVCDRDGAGVGEGAGRVDRRQWQRQEGRTGRAGRCSQV